MCQISSQDVSLRYVAALTRNKEQRSLTHHKGEPTSGCHRRPEFVAVRHHTREASSLVHTRRGPPVVVPRTLSKPDVKTAHC